MDNKNTEKKKKPSVLGIIVFIILLLSSIGDAGSGVMAAVIPLVIAIAIFSFVFAAASKKKGTAKGTAGTQPVRRQPVSAPRPTAAPAQHHKRRQPEIALHRDFPSPDAYCVVCDNTDTDHFALDRKQRLQQLDYWLKIGMIEKPEYLALRKRYQNVLPYSTE